MATAATTVTEHVTSDPPGAAAATPDGELGGLTAEAWDGLAGRHFYSTAAWLGFCSAHGGANQDAAVSCSGGEPAAVVPVAELVEPAPSLYRWNDILAQYGLPTVASSGLLVGPRQGYQTHLLVAPGADRKAAIMHLGQELRDRSAAAFGAMEHACVAMYVTTDDAAALADGGVTAPPVLLDADAWLEIPPGGWDAWLDTLPAKRRGSIRREVRAFRGAGYEIEHRPLAECYEQLPDLAEATQSKYGNAAAAAEHLESLRRHVDCMGPAARVAVCRRDGGDPAGFCVYYVWGDTIFLRWAGFDYKRLAGVAEYFNLAYYAQVMLASELAVRRIHAGIKAPEAKSLRGAQLRPLWLVDLAADSALARHPDAVRNHNAHAFERLVRTVPVESAFGDRDAWLAFC